MQKRKAYCYLFLFVALFVHCKKLYQPKLIQQNNHYLVVGGIINTMPNSSTTITLSRTLNLTDSNINIPELNASLFIEGKTGTKYPLVPQGASGSYTSDTLFLDNSDQFRLDISTSDGDSFQSDFVSPRQTGPIDSLNWIQNEEGVTVYVNTHDPTDSSRYYWWEYIETWRYESPLSTPYMLLPNGTIEAMDYPDQIQICFQNHQSTDLLLANSTALSQDVISMQPLLTIPPSDSRLFYRYSILVNQYALTPQAYQYWETIKTNSQELGTLFDPEPSQLTGNIQSLKFPSEPVVGYVSAARRQQMRIFIDNGQLTPRTYDSSYNYACSVRETEQDPNNLYVWHEQDTTYAPYYFAGGGTLVIAKKICLDCRVQGGTTQIPLFW